MSLAQTRQTRHIYPTTTGNQQDVTCSCFCFSISCCIRLSSSTFCCEHDKNIK